MGNRRKSNAQSDSDKEAVERALRGAQLKIVALETMITLAEEQFKIDIRKKSGPRWRTTQTVRVMQQEFNTGIKNAVWPVC